MSSRVFFIALLIMSFTKTHDYFLSTTNVRWVPEKQQLQLTSRFFLEDVEALMQKEVNAKTQFSPDSSKEEIDAFVARFYQKNMYVKFDGISQEITYLGREYQDDLLVIYAEVNTTKKEFQHVEISASFLLEFLPTQQNIFHISFPKKKKSFLLTKKKTTLNFII